MSFNFINGYLPPVFFTKNLDGTTKGTIQFSFEYKILWNEPELIILQDEDIGGSLVEEPLGVINHYTFDLSDKTDLENAAKIKKLLNWFLSRENVFMMPYGDIPSMVDNVALEMTSNRLRLKIANFVQAAYSGGNIGLVLPLRSKKRIPYVNWVNPNEIIGVLSRGKKKIISAT